MSEKNLSFSAKAIKEEGGLVASFEVADADFDVEGRQWPGLEGRARASLEFSVGGNAILLQGRVSGAWRLVCGRCLREHARPFEASFEETYPLEEERLETAEAVAQAMLLEIPQRPLCALSCRGLCPRCGENLNAGSCACPAEPRPINTLRKV